MNADIERQEPEQTPPRYDLGFGMFIFAIGWGFGVATGVMIYSIAYLTGKQ